MIPYTRVGKRQSSVRLLFHYNRIASKVNISGAKTASEQAKLLHRAMQESETVCYCPYPRYRCTEAMQYAPSDAAVTT